MTTLRVPVSERDHLKGPPWAPVTLVEYGDYQCPFCGQAFLVLQELERRLGNDLRFVFRHFPLSEIHPYALGAAEAAEAASAQGRFWDMHDRLYLNQDALDPDSLLEHAAALDLDVEQFANDLEAHRFLPRIEADFMGGVRSGVNGTPCFFINNVRHDGSWDGPSLLRAIERAKRQAGIEAR
ncbi:MAG: bdbD [Myxococcales bacterium]|nr:bdbD [Myxococcales bacterium]